MLIAGRNGKPVDRDTRNSGTVSNCVAVAAPARPRGISQHSRLDIPQMRASRKCDCCNPSRSHNMGFIALSILLAGIWWWILTIPDDQYK